MSRQTAAWGVVVLLFFINAGGIMYAGEIHDAIKAQDIEAVEQILDSRPDLVNSLSDGKTTPLHLAVSINNGALIDLLIKNGAGINAKTENGYTPLHLAAYIDAREAATLLISHGSDIKSMTSTALTPFHVAVLRNSRNVAEELLKNTSCAYTDHFLDSRSEKGMKALETGDIILAKDIVYNLLEKNPGNENINFAYGMICNSLEDYSGAGLSFERVLEANPANQRARVELACAHLAGGEKELAEAAFNEVMAQNPSPEVQDNIKSYIQETQQKKGNWRLVGRIDAGYFKDNNVNVGPESDVIDIAPTIFDITTLTVDESSLPTESKGTYAAFTGVGIRDVGENGKWFLMTDLLYYQNWLNDADENESQFYKAGIGFRKLASRSLLETLVSVAHITSGHEPLVNMYAFNPSYRYASGTGGKMHWISSGTVEIRDYDELGNRDGVYVSFTEMMENFFGSADRHSITMGISIFHDYTDEPVYEHTGNSWIWGIQLKGPLNTIIYSRVVKTSIIYAAKENLAPEKREDSQDQFMIGLTKKIGKSLMIDVNQQRNDKNSTFGLYQYERNITTISMSYTF